MHAFCWFSVQKPKKVSAAWLRYGRCDCGTYGAYISVDGSIVWMVPSFASLFTVSTNFADAFTVAIVAHALTGVAADAFGVWLVASWRLRADMSACFAKKGIMRVTIGLWLIALFLGILLYLKITQIL